MGDGGLPQYVAQLEDAVQRYPTALTTQDGTQYLTEEARTAAEQVGLDAAPEIVVCRRDTKGHTRLDIRFPTRTMHVSFPPTREETASQYATAAGVTTWRILDDAADHPPMTLVIPQRLPPRYRRDGEEEWQQYPADMGGRVFREEAETVQDFLRAVVDPAEYGSGQVALRTSEGKPAAAMSTMFNVYRGSPDKQCRHPSLASVDRFQDTVLGLFDGDPSSYEAVDDQLQQVWEHTA